MASSIKAIVDAVEARLAGPMAALTSGHQELLARIVALDARVAAVQQAIVAMQNALAPGAIAPPAKAAKAAAAAGGAPAPKGAKAKAPSAFPNNKFGFFVQCARDDKEGARAVPAVANAPDIGSRHPKGTAAWYSAVARNVWSSLSSADQALWDDKYKRAKAAREVPVALDYDAGDAGDAGEGTGDLDGGAAGGAEGALADEDYLS